MKALSQTLILAAVLLCGSPVFGASNVSNEISTCAADWNGAPSLAKSSFVMGWLRGIEAADRLTSDVIMSYLWPKGHRVGSIVLEIDVECQRPENRNANLIDIIQGIAIQKNK